MHDRGKQHICIDRYALSFIFKGKLSAESAHHSIWDIQSSTGQVWQKLSALINWCTAVVIKKKRKCPDVAIIIHIINDSGRKWSMNAFSHLAAIINICMIFCHIQDHSDAYQLFNDRFWCLLKKNYPSGLFPEAGEGLPAGSVPVLYGRVPYGLAGLRVSCWSFPCCSWSFPSGMFWKKR